MKLKNLFVLTLILFCIDAFGSQKHKEKCLIIEIDTVHSTSQVGYNLCQTKDPLKKDAYILNVRFKLNETSKSQIGSDADFIFVFYVLPKRGDLKLVEANQIDVILEKKINNVSEIKNLLLNTQGSIDKFDFIPLISYKGKLFKFMNADIFGQAFNLKEAVQYFPDYQPLVSNRYELNLLSKPYTQKNIAMIQKIMAKDTTGFKHFDYDGFDGKWNIKSIDKLEKSIDFWIQLTSVATGNYSFGRFSEEIRFKLNVGVVSFKVQPLRPVFDEKYMTKYKAKLVSFSFKNFVNLKTLIN